MKTLFVLISLWSFCQGQGAPWTEEETLNIYNKLYLLAHTPNKAIKQYKNLYPDREYVVKTDPNAPKMLRLGFHDCIPYEDAADGELTGCDGCLNSQGMMTNVEEFFNTGRDEFNAPNIQITDNNGLMYIADILEEIYTNPHFPKSKDTEALPMSMKESGKSRADLWAFAALVASKYGIENNNLACAGTPRATCGYVYHFEDDCHLEWNQPPPFKTGRKDCTPDPDLDRPFLTTRPEVHPNAEGNGPTTVNYYAENFGFTAREAIALMEGAHSFGKFNSEISFRPYTWTRSQQRLLNNQMFRQAASRPQWFMDCTGGEFRMIGDAYGNMPNTTWRIRAMGMMEGGGPFQWFHAYDRCPASNDCAALDSLDRAEPNTPEGCCDDLDNGMQCQPWCSKFYTNGESSMSVDLGMYQKFDNDPETGRPIGCPGFPGSWENGEKSSTWTDSCPLEDFAPQGEPLYSIIEDYADNAQKWMDDFFVVLDKMSSNGYTDLTVNSFNYVEA